MNGNEVIYAITVIAAVGALSLLIRALPFLLFGQSSKPPRTVSYIGRVLSPAAIAMLCVYCFAGYVCDRPPQEHCWMLAEFMAGAATVIIHWKWRSPLISIAAGTALYMTMVNFV
jgi:branched-subunit amino acid transport protein AzlD